MKCPYCFDNESKVTDKRQSGDLTRRRRECLKCGKRFTTYERIEPVEIFIIKKDGRRELFDREKLRTGLLKACEKRPINKEQIDKIVKKIEKHLRKFKREITTHKIGEAVMNELKKLDKIAYIRFASVYREFADIDDFKVAIATLKPRELKNS